MRSRRDGELERHWQPGGLVVGVVGGLVGRERADESREVVWSRRGRRRRRGFGSGNSAGLGRAKTSRCGGCVVIRREVSSGHDLGRGVGTGVAARRRAPLEC
jgi:hypothetical protein